MISVNRLTGMIFRVNKYLDDLEHRQRTDRQMSLLETIEARLWTLERLRSLEHAQKVPDQMLEPKEKTSHRPSGLNDRDRCRSL